MRGVGAAVFLVGLIAVAVGVGFIDWRWGLIVAGVEAVAVGLLIEVGVTDAVRQEETRAHQA